MYGDSCKPSKNCILSQRHILLTAINPRKRIYDCGDQAQEVGSVRGRALDFVILVTEYFQVFHLEAEDYDQVWCANSFL